LTVTVYHLSESRSERIVWLLEELSTPYQLVEFKRLVPSMEAPPEYRALHPMGTSPMIGDDGQILIESGTIVEYILERYGSGRLVPPRKTPEHTRYLQWMHFSEGMAMSGLMNEGLLLMNGADPAQSSILGSLRRRNDRMMDYIDGELGRSRYFAGDEFSAADIMMTFIFPVYIRFLQRPLAPYPNIAQYLHRIEARPAYERAMGRANPNGAHW
jgi:glutathione S-transferase